MFEVWWAIQ